MYVFKEPSEISFDKVGIKGKIFPIEELKQNIEFVIVSTKTGHETTIIEKESTFAYYILEGSGYFEIDDVKENCSVGDLVVIPPGKKFIYKGNMKLLLVNTPPWSEDQEVTLDS